MQREGMPSTGFLDPQRKLGKVINPCLPWVVQFAGSLVPITRPIGKALFRKDSACLWRCGTCLLIGALSLIYTRQDQGVYGQDVTLLWTRHDFLYVAGKIKICCWAFLDGHPVQILKLSYQNMNQKCKATQTNQIHFPQDLTQICTRKCNQLLNIRVILGWRPDAYKLGLKEITYT